MASARDPERVWYIGIGSMMNGTALRLRDIEPTQSVWCEILDHKRVFYGPATLIEEEGSVVHAVAHELTLEERVNLESREPPSKPIRVRLRGGAQAGAVIDAVASVDIRHVLHGVHLTSEQHGKTLEQTSSGGVGRVADQSLYRGLDGTVLWFWNRIVFDTVGEVTIDGVGVGVPTAVSTISPAENLPTARYVSLMVEGAREAGMPADVVESIADTPCVPRRSAGELSKLPRNPTVTRQFGYEELMQHDNYIVFRDMVLESSVPRYSPFTPTRYRGVKDISYHFSHQFYDPMYGKPPEDPLEAWQGWEFIEDMTAMLFFSGGSDGYEHVGWIHRGALNSSL